MTHPEPPPEAKRIVEKDWSYLHDLHLRGWRDELLRLATLLDPVDAVWSDGIDDMHHAYIGPPVVQLLDKPDADGEKYLSLRLHRIELPALLVNFIAPDAVIIAEFMRAMAAVRVKHPTHAAQPGRKAHNARFDQHHFRAWIRRRIVPFCELLAWRSGLDADEQDGCPNAALGKWLGRDECETSRTNSALHDALASIPALSAQIASEKV